MTRKVVPPGRPVPGMSAAVQAAGLIYVAGQVATDADGAVVGEGDYRAQAIQCFKNVEQILAEMGARLTDVIQVTGYLADAAYASEYLAVRGEVFPVDPPATTTVVAALLLPKLLVEVQVVAALPA